MLYSELLRRPNVIACYIGKKVSRKQPQDRLALVCCVSQKVDRRELDPATERIPRSVSWALTSERTGRLPTDVQVLEEPFVRQTAPIVGPGDLVETAVELGTIGVVISHPGFGAVASTAGHVLLGEEQFPACVTFPAGALPPVRVQSVNARGEVSMLEGRAVKACLTESADYALVALAPTVERANVWQDRLPLGGPFIPSTADLDRPLLVLGTDRRARTHFRGLHGTVPFGSTRMSNLLLTDAVTSGGDSGSVLMDLESRVWGLLVGSAIVDGRDCSAFMSITVLLDDEHAHLV
jgi:hypothetical protein